MTDPLRPAGSRAWTPVSRTRAESLSYAEGYEVQFKRFIGAKGWQPLRISTQHEPRTSYRARKLSSA